MKDGYQVQQAALGLLKTLPSRDIGHFGIALAKLAISFRDWKGIKGTQMQAAGSVHIYANKLSPSIGWLCTELINEIEIERDDMLERCTTYIQEMHSILRIDTTKLLALGQSINVTNESTLHEITADCFLEFSNPTDEE